MGNASVVLFENAGVRYEGGPPVLQNISFALPPGSFHFLVGPSGAGKSSLLRLMYLALRPAEGRVSLFGRDVSTLKRHEIPELRRRIGVVFQDFRLLDHLSAMDNVALPLRVAGVRESEIRRHVPELLKWVGLGDHLTSLPATLSGGQQQRVAIARALVTSPRLLLLDEVTSALDPELVGEVLDLLIELKADGMTMVVATHEMGFARRVADEVCFLHEGRVHERGAPEQVLGDPVEQRTRDFLRRLA